MPAAHRSPSLGANSMNGTKMLALELSVKDRQSFNIPVWLGAGVMFAGVLLLVVRTER